MTFPHADQLVNQTVAAVWRWERGDEEGDDLALTFSGGGALAMDASALYSEAADADPQQLVGATVTRITAPDAENEHWLKLELDGGRIRLYGDNPRLGA